MPKRYSNLNRRQFFETGFTTVSKGVLLASGLAALTPYELMRMLGSFDEKGALKRLWDWQVADEVYAATLPLNYVVTAGTVPTGGNFANGIAELTTDSGSGAGTSSASDNTNATLIKNGGTKNIFITMTGVGGTRTHEVRCTLSPVVLDTVPTIGFRYYSDTGMNSLGYSWANDSGAANRYDLYMTGMPNPTTFLGWQYRRFHRDSSLTTGAPSWQTDFVLTRAIATAGNGTTKSFYLDQEYYNPVQAGVLAWIFTGASDTFYSIAYGEFNTKMIRGTLAIPTSLVGTGGFMTWNNIIEMQQAGWDVISMSDTTTALTSLTVAQVETRLAAAETAFQTNGVNYLKGIIALPGSTGSTHRSDANVLTALENRGYTMAIDEYGDGTGSASSVGCDPVYGYSLNPYRVPATRIQNPETLASMKGDLSYIAYGVGPIIHRTGAIAGAGTDGQINPADFTALMNPDASSYYRGVGLYHAAGTIRCVPLSKMLAGLSGRMLRA